MYTIRVDDFNLIDFLKNTSSKSNNNCQIFFLGKRTPIKQWGSLSPFLSYKRLKLKLRVFLAGHRVAMVTYSVTKIIPTCSPVIGQSFDTMIAASIDKDW